MKRILLNLIFTFPVFAVQSPFTPAVDSLIHEGIELSFSSNFDSALFVFKQVCQEMPDHPVGPFYMAATYQSKMMHYETDQWEDLFYHYIDTTLILADIWIERKGEDAWILLFRGNVLSYQGLYEAKRGDLITGFIHAETGMDDLQRAVKLDSSLYDAFVGIGNYKYWAGKYYKYIRWLPFIRDERKLGKAEIQISIEKGLFSYWLGLNSLAWVNYDCEKYNQAIKLFQTGSSHFKNSLMWIWGLADTYKKAGQYEAALELYNRIVDTVKDDSLESGYNEVLARWKIIQCLKFLNRPEEVLVQGDLIQNRSVEASRFNKAEECRAKAQKACKWANNRIQKLRNKDEQES